MSDGLRWFAEYQAFTPIIETLRGLLMNKPVGNRRNLDRHGIRSATGSRLVETAVGATERP